MNEVKAASGYHRLLKLGIKGQQMPRDIATWLGDLLVFLAGSRGDSDEKKRAEVGVEPERKKRRNKERTKLTQDPNPKDYAKLLVELLNHEVTAISPFVLTCLWRMCLVPRTRVMLIHLGCVEAVIVYLKRALASSIEAEYEGATQIAVGVSLVVRLELRTLASYF